jgi:hypothetical protein
MCETALFHVEHPPLIFRNRGPHTLEIRTVDTTHQNLTAQTAQQGSQGGAMPSIQLGGQIVDEKHAISLPIGGEHPRLRHLHRTDNQFLLASGEHLLRTLAFYPDPDVGPVRTLHRKSAFMVTA